MIDLYNIDFSQISLCEIMIKIMADIRDDFSEEKTMNICKEKIQEALLFIPNKLTEKKKIEKLLFLFYKIWKFGSSVAVYKLSDMIWLDKVILSNQGSSFSLGIILIYIASHLNILITPIIFPTQLILKFKNPEKKFFYIDPINGDIINKHTLKIWLKGNISPSAELTNNYLQDSQPLTVTQKILDILKVALLEEKSIELALNVSNILLRLKPKDPYEIRDRGLIFSQLNCYHIAISDLLYFIEKCPEDPISDIIKMQIHSIEQKKITFH
ncbi:tetratricopeptide repeat protein [Buchnera aphidicola]|uniref:UPF0162 protein YchA n=1 Tax=Buchnera aphidicola (Cinara cf. splendens/pseudotsugae 3390) TaxID=2518980 RepID=A0A451CX68_9GAMM|nr:tetratricopeptide repeat protein [Buchnera aphidicola]VFP77691.1 UPF0162 protein YchA [Buchnera aphidicola (Cinara cf. splendens/pseudotsugae 3390)]